jgi:hypothetical protein
MQLPVIKDEIRLVEIIPLGTIILITLGYFNLYSYYSFFGIDITSYLDPSEIIFAFSSVLIRLIYLTLIVCILYAITLVSKDELAARPTRIVGKIAKVFSLLALPIFFIAVSMLIFLKEVLVDFKGIYLLGTFILLSWMILYRSTITHFRNRLLTVAVLVIVYIQMSNKLKFRNIMDGQVDRMTIQLANETILTSADLWYVGATRNYLFCYDRSNKITKVYPTHLIKSISVHRDSEDSDNRVFFKKFFE